MPHAPTDDGPDTRVEPLTAAERAQVAMLVTTFGIAPTARRLGRSRQAVVTAMAGAPMRDGGIVLIRAALARVFGQLSADDLALLHCLSERADTLTVAQRLAADDDAPTPARVP